MTLNLNKTIVDAIGIIFKVFGGTLVLGGI